MKVRGEVNLTCLIRQNGRVTDPIAATVSVTLDEEGGINLSLSPTEHPVEVLRRAAAVLERYAANLEREQAPVHCPVCGDEPRGVSARPTGEWRLEPCGHGVPAATGEQAAPSS